MHLAHTGGMAKPPPVHKNKNEDEHLTFWQRLQKASAWSGHPCLPGDVATELGINPSAVSKYVNGGYPTKDRINALARKRGVRSEWLLSGQGDMVAEEALDETTLEMLKLFRLLPDDAQQRLLSSARYESVAAETIETGKREALTERLIGLLESRRNRDRGS